MEALPPCSGWLYIDKITSALLSDAAMMLDWQC